MKNRAFLLGSLLFFINIAIDCGMFFMGLTGLGALLCMGTILVFAAGIIWLIYKTEGKKDEKFYFHRGWLLIPLVVFGAGMDQVLQKITWNFTGNPENLQEIGTLMTATYQIGFWVVALILFFVFIIAASLMVRRRA